MLPVMTWAEREDITPLTLTPLHDRFQLRNNHRQYAIFWAVMGLCLFGVYMLRSLQRT